MHSKAVRQMSRWKLQKARRCPLLNNRAILKKVDYEDVMMIEKGVSEERTVKMSKHTLYFSTRSMF